MSGEFQTFSALDFDREHLLLRFKRYIWVEKVLHVTVTHPNRVTVQLEYVEPVAMERLADRPERTIVNGDGVILPREDIDFGRVGPLIQLYRFEPPVAPTFGETWKTQGSIASQGRSPGSQ